MSAFSSDGGKLTVGEWESMSDRDGSMQRQGSWHFGATVHYADGTGFADVSGYAKPFYDQLSGLPVEL
ncbi:hypothetical protein [Paenibacillus caui]|uniref:hypothetical protein n=1 Tax=Paenibacillus caui TaxID=2873927 RepID=UPI001CA93C66|nr:hypothetical protein [Paenibacillus caui]